MRAVLLFAHGARDPSWALPFIAIRDAVRSTADDLEVELCFLELMQPGLPETAASLIARGATELTVVPLFMAQGGHLKKDLPLLLEALRASHPEVAVKLTSAIGDVPELTRAIASWVVGVTRPSP